MKDGIDYSPDGKNRLEIDKLHAEVSELRSSVRRWTGLTTSFLGIAAVTVSIIVTSNQIKQSASEADREKKEVASQKAELAAKEAEISKKTAEYDTKLALASRAESEKKRDEALVHAKTAEASAAEAQTNLTAAQKRLEEADRQAAELQTQAGSSQLLKESAVAELNAARAELVRVQEETRKLAETLQLAPGQKKAAETATQIAASSTTLVKDEAARVRLAEDNTKARLFIFVVDSAQKENAWKLSESLQRADCALANVLVFGGKREETPVLRYFRDQDKLEAERIRDVLNDLGFGKTRASRVVDPESVGTGRKYQFWVRKENLRSDSPNGPFVGNFIFEIDQYSIVAKPIVGGRWLCVYVANPNDDEAFRCVVFTSDKDETTAKGERKLFTAPPGSLCDELFLPDKARARQNKPPFERDAFGGRVQITIPSSSFRKATLQVSWHKK